MKELLAPFDSKFKEVLEAVSMCSRLGIVFLEKLSVERNFCLNRALRDR